ncbi:DUF3347 domain-containing protein [Olivibacter sp. XZL3]|uniref:DUF3347 domain-containing protein n=1 Tax=Olivibacter sp. XZL3 TaxID=1735116 RepID=UPI0010669BD1|nr:DUF3347 domain-containing protein [Olivibacter sp. XZL3]
MKTVNETRAIFYTILIFVLTSCNTGNKNNLPAEDTIAVSAQGIVMDNDTLSQVFAAYINVKDALVASDPKLAGEASNKLSESLKGIHGCENTAIAAQELANSTDLALQRSAFSSISKDLIAMYQRPSLSAGKIYVIHCPMYNNNEGGDWLSTSPEIKNPYFGEEMLTCGTVTQEIE